MMLSCPSCASEDVNVLELGDGDTPDLYECEGCDEQFTEDECVGG